MPDPPGTIILPDDNTPSPAELVKVFINNNADSSVIPAGAVVGGANDSQQQSGVISLMDAGNADIEMYAPIWKKRVQVRAMGPTLAVADSIGNYAYEFLHEQRWINIEDSAGIVWFVHSIYCAVGPSHHVDTAETKESLFIAIITLGRNPVGIP